MTGQETFQTNGQLASASASGASASGFDLDGLKQEILAEMRKEIQKAKQDIIEGMIYLFKFLLIL